MSVFRYGFYTDLDDDELLGYFPLKLEEYNTAGDFAEMDIIFNRRVHCNAIQMTNKPNKGVVHVRLRPTDPPTQKRSSK